ncbi:MAG: hypothetical protein IJ194_02175 [Bacilli bacterium]|nr:hypothetical protein [Bacilli bacterium]
MNRLFDKIPEELFAPLSRKYKTIYAFALVSLYHMLKLYKTDIKRVDYANLLKSQGSELMALFSVETDRLDDKDESEGIEMEAYNSEDENAILSAKVSYVVRKLAKCGWYIISRDPKNNVEYIYIPAYSIQFLTLLNSLTSDAGSYLPLVHQTYAELKMEDEKEDDYMYRSLLNAKTNADSLEMSVTLLRQQICVFGNRLTHVLDPNVALQQHFDEYRVDIADKYYHPMKTFDSLGLYAQPTISILNKWLKSQRIITLLVKEAKTEPVNRNKSIAELTTYVIKLISSVIDIFSRLTSAFNEIDHANANYTEAVQKKVNYLSATDKTVKGKIDRIILALATEIKNNPNLRYEEMPILNQATDSIELFRQGCLDSFSLQMPYKRGAKNFEEEPLPLADDFFPDDSASLLMEKFDNELNRFSDSTITQFMERNFQDKKEITTTEIQIENTDDMVLMILGVLKAMLGLIPYKAEKIADRIEYQGYYMPEYKFTRKKGAR